MSGNYDFPVAAEDLDSSLSVVMHLHGHLAEFGDADEEPPASLVKACVWAAKQSMGNWYLMGDDDRAAWLDEDDDRASYMSYLLSGASAGGVDVAAESEEWQDFMHRVLTAERRRLGH